MEQNDNLRNETSRRKPFIKALVAVLVAALAAFVLLPITSRNVEAAGVVREADSWSKLRDAISDSGDGDIVEITQDIVASQAQDKNGNTFNTINLSGGKTVTIRAKGDGKYTIWRQDGDADFPMFQTSNNDKAHLILGEGLTLTGMTCGGAPSAGEFKVVFHNGGEGDKAKQTNPVVVNVGESIVKDPADIDSDWAPETGLVFKGWKFKGPNGGDNNTSSNTPNTSTGNWKVPADKYGTMTLVAQWEKAGSGSGDLSYNDGQVFYIENNTNLKMYGPGGSYDHTYQTTAFIRDGGVYVRKDGSEVQIACYNGNLYLKQGSYSSYPNLTVETINGKTYLKEVSRSSKNGHYIFPKGSGNGGFDSSTTAEGHHWNWVFA